MSNKKSASELIFKAIFAAEKKIVKMKLIFASIFYNYTEQKSLFSSADPHSN